MTAADPTGLDPATSIRLGMLQEIYDLGVVAAGDVWPTPTMALGRLFERGAAFLDDDAVLPKLTGRADAELLDALNIARDDLFLVEALYLLTRYVTFVLTQESDRLETIWLGLADRHLAIRAQIVERRRDEEQLKRQLRALGGEAVFLPEHEDLPMSDGDRPRKSRGMYLHLFDGAASLDVDLEVSASALAAADRVIQKRRWDRDWGADAQLLILTQGISLALREREADGTNVDDTDAVAAMQSATRKRLVGLEGRYSTLRRRLFELRHNNRILGWRISALEVEAVGMRRRLDLFLVDRDRLEQAIAERVATGAVPALEASTAPERAWRRRLGRLFGRRS